MTERRQLILKSIVDCYTATGEPVGSKAVCDSLDFAVSSATVRNDMAELTQMGLILQPHTSAGRIPSPAGYELYAERFASSATLSDDVIADIDDELMKNSDSPENILSSAIRIIARMCKGAVFVSSPLSVDERVNRINLVCASRHSGMMVLVTSQGLIKTGIFRCDYIITKDILAIFENIINEKLTGIRLDAITQPFIQTLALSLGEIGLLMSELLWTIMKASEEAVQLKLFSTGEMEALFLPDYDKETARDLSMLYRNKKRMADFIKSIKEDMLIGEKTGIRELSSSSVFSKRYKTGNGLFGVLMLVTPMRTDYSLCMPLIKHMASAIENYISLICVNDGENITDKDYQ